MEEYRLGWELGGQPQMSERVHLPGNAADLVVRREDFEGRLLHDEEYELLVIFYDGEGCRQASVWRDECGLGIHAYVAALRRCRAPRT